ncbi:MAG: flavin reductase family protein [Lachnospiraceae bacterium]|nr:flavin reductase family protein [Lachnospiraceae bacterium]
MEFTTEIFGLFHIKRALLTAGNKDKFNTMTIGWGGLGTIWNKPMATVYVRESRYTHDFMDENDYFTISVYPDEYKKILGILGQRSGRDMDKMNDSGLTPKILSDSVTFEEAEVTFVCKKVFKQRIPIDMVPKDARETFYSDGDPHDMYIGEVVEVIKK